MFSIERYISQFCKKPYYSPTLWASTSGVALPQTVSIDQTRNDPMFIFAYIFVGVSVNGSPFDLSDNFGTKIFDFGAVVSTGEIVTAEINHIFRGNTITFTSTHITSFSIGYQWISEWPKSMEDKGGRFIRR